MSAVRTHRVGREEADQRLDRWFRNAFPELSFGQLQKMLRTGQIRLDGKRAKGSERLAQGQEIRIPPLPAASETAKAARRHRADGAASGEEGRRLQARVLYKDAQILAIDKPAGLAVQGGSGQSRHLDAFLPALAFESEEAPRLVHRLDKDTSGVLLLARTQRAARLLTKAFREDAVRKLYWAAVAGVPKPGRGRIDLPLAKGGERSEKMLPDREQGQEAETLYATVAAMGRQAAWLALRPVTGRTHQLRAHCAAIGHPILGDGKYGGKAAHPKGLDLPGQLLLHARQIALPHPEDGTTLRIEAPMPAHMLLAWRALGFDPDDPRGDPFED